MSHFRRIKLSSAIIFPLLCQLNSHLYAGTTTLFNSSQIIQLTTAGTTSDTYTTQGYLITVTRDKLFTGGGPVIIGRGIRVPWPNGMEVQGVTTVPNQSKAKLSISRVDGQPFALTSFTVYLLGSTASGGGSIEVMPLINGEDGLTDPVAFDASGPSNYSVPTHTTSLFTGHNYDSYKFTLYVDYALTSLTLADASQPAPQAPAPPMPSITQTSSTGYKISWPGPVFDYTLQTCTDLVNGPWVPYVGVRLLEGSFNIVNVVSTDTRRFFRLSN